jgi:hypothetical protein
MATSGNSPGIPLQKMSKKLEKLKSGQRDIATLTGSEGTTGLANYFKTLSDARPNNVEW